jgi:hypothetical protein
MPYLHSCIRRRGMVLDYAQAEISGYRSRGQGSIPGATRFSEKLCLERSPLSLVSTIEELLERKNSGSGLENRDHGLRGSAALATQQPTIRKS